MGIGDEATQERSDNAASPEGRGEHAALFSHAALGLALAVIAATFFLISPQPGKTYPGAIPWSDYSVLHRVTDLMSLNGLVATVRGVEIKDFAFHLAAALGLLLVGVRALTLRGAGFDGGPARSATWAQVLLAGWVLVSLLSSLWAGDASMARSQALLYALGLAWAVALGGSLDRQRIPLLLHGLMVVAALGALLCVWYFYERNPFHRPGFPLGNPNVLAAVILPATLVALTTLAGHAELVIRQRRWTASWPVTMSLLALVPLGWCLILTEARGALLALAATLVLILVPRAITAILGRRSILLTGVVLLLAAGAGGAAWWYRTPHPADSMAREASIRLRLYAWRYAAELWQASPVLGHGAGAYPRLAGYLAARDQALDPAAFMGEIVEHAHNELFEVLTEIGLFGGVVYVGGLVATLLAGLAALRATSGPEHWWRLGLLGGVFVLLLDGVFGTTLRLPGGAAVFFTLLGTLWAACRCGANEITLAPPVAAVPAPWHVLTAVVCLATAGAAGWLAVRDWSGACLEQQAIAAYEPRQYSPAVTGLRDAEARLLDPVRVIACRKLAVEARFAQAGEAVAALTSTQPTKPGAAGVTEAVELAERAYDEAQHLGTAVPALTHTDALAARAAEWLVELHRADDPNQAAQWARQAEQAWRRQRGRTPYDVDTLLALTRYPATLEGHVALLRDALRFGETQGAWLKALGRLQQAPGFEQTLDLFVAAAGPITPQTDVDALVASMAPETLRLAAAWRAAQGDFATAAVRSADAARLYHPMRARFPKLYSIALAEQADYTLRGDPHQAAAAVSLLTEALAALPEIQTQKYEDMVRPFRVRLALSLLAAERPDEALAVIRLLLGEQAGDALVTERVLLLLLREAANLGVDVEALGRVRATLCPRFPGLCARAAERAIRD